MATSSSYRRILPDPGTCLRRWGAVALFLLAGCASVPRETVESITAREPVLLRAASAFGVIYETGGDAAVTWTDRGTLLLTPTSLYFVSATTHSLSYAMVTGASMRTLPDRIAFVRGTRRDNLLTVEVSRPVCEAACVFNLVDEPDLTPRAIEIIEEGRASVDPFGRTDGPKPVWLAAGIRNSRFWWSETPAYIQAKTPERKQQLDKRFCDRLDCCGRGNSAIAYGEGLREVLAGSSDAGYQFRQLPGVVLNRRAELNTRVLADLLNAEDPEVDALLVSDVTAITLRERISAAYDISVEVTILSFVDYFDLEPLKDGRYFWSEFRTVRTLDEWLATDDSSFTEMLKAAARQTGCQVLAELKPVAPGNSLPCPG